MIEAPRLKMIKELMDEAIKKAKREVLMDIQPIVINFTSQRELQDQAYQAILKTVSDAFNVAKGNLEKMELLHQAAKELRYATAQEIDRLKRGPVPEKDGMERSFLS